MSYISLTEMNALQILALVIHQLCGRQHFRLMVQPWPLVVMTKQYAYGTAISQKASSKKLSQVAEGLSIMSVSNNCRISTTPENYKATFYALSPLSSGIATENLIAMLRY